MAIASSNFTILGYGNYTNPGTGSEAAPTSLKEIAMTGESLGYQTQSISSSNINSSRQILDTIQTGYDVSGGIQIEFAPKVYDKFLSASLWAAWQASEVNDAITVSIDHDHATPATARTITVSTSIFSATPVTDKIAVGQFFRLKASGASPIDSLLEGVYQVESVTSGTVAVVKAVDGATPFKASATTADATIQASMIRAPENGASTNMIRQSFLLEKRQSDLATELFTYFTKCYVNTFSLSAQSAALLTGSIDFMGATSAMQTTSLATGTTASYTSADSFNGYNAVNHVKEVIVNGKNLNGTANTQFIQGFDFQVTNNLRGAKAIGHLGNVDTLAGQLGITGNMNVFFENKNMYDLFINQTEFALSFRIENENGDSYVFSFPRVTISSDSMSSGGNDQDLVENMQWTAMFDSTLKTSMQIDRLYTTY
jgi:hypothetical protein